MYLHNHITGLANVVHYSAPQGRIIIPYAIKPGSELIEILTGGKVFFTQDNQEKVYEKGAIFWHVAGDFTIHKTPPDDPYRCLVLCFLTNSQTIRYAPHVSRWAENDTLDDFVEEMLKSFHDDNYDNNILGPYAYATVFWQSYRYSLRKNVPMPNSLKKLINYINNNLENELAVKDLANIAGISEPHLYAQFKKYLKLSPHQYIMQRRLQKSRRLLASSRCNIKEISFECGFANIECFYRAFRKKYQLSPGEYRSRHLPYQ